jgi:hypothetical protein
MLQVGSVITLTGPVTFGRDAALFESLLSFVAQLSVVLWALVVLTLVIRFIGIFMYRRGAAGTGLVGVVAPSATVPAAATTTTFDELLPPAGVSAAASAKSPRRDPAFAATSTGW